MPVRSRAPLSLVVGSSGTGASDADLARSLVAGEAWAVVETWHRFAPLVIMTAERALGSKSEAEDVAQEVFQRVFRKANTLRDIESLRSFIYSFAVRILKAELRYRRVRAWLMFRRSEMIVDVGGSTMDVEARDLLRKFYVLLDRLNSRDRLVFLLRRTESMTIEEIAETMDLSISTVKRSMAHASKKLSRWVDADPELAGLLPRLQRADDA
jgi:RNA polymerase sigma factor (sigma-70 family)